MIDVPILIGDEEVRLRSDDLNYTLCYKKKSSSKTCGYRWVPRYYYYSLTSALLAITEKQVKQSSATSIVELIELTKEFYLRHLELMERLRDMEGYRRTGGF